MSVGGHYAISARTRLLAVLGHPISHSLSPAMHNAALRYQGVDAVYLAFDVAPEELEAALEGLRALQVWGANLTLPHKERALHLVDSLDPLAQKVGAVNTLVNRSGHLCGYNTDVQGFTATLQAVRPQGAEGAVCLVAGAGGAARAVLASLITGGAETIWLFNRTKERALTLRDEASEWGRTKCEVIGPDGLREVATQSDIIVNATSVGLQSTVKESPIPVDIIDSHHVVVDLVYGKEKTLLVSEATARGAIAVDGTEMLLAQAAISYRLWTGMEAPFSVLRKGIEQASK